ncbi:unnamed protein product [Gordionus sp. m RMFG-2023]
MRSKCLIPILSVFLLASLLYLSTRYQYWYTMDINVNYLNSRFQHSIKFMPDLSDWKKVWLRFIDPDPYTDSQDISDIENEMGQYQFLDENSNTTIYRRFQLLNIPRAFFIHNPSEICLDMGWRYDFSSKYQNKSVDTISYANYDDEQNIHHNNDSFPSLYKNYLKFINDGNIEDNDYLFEKKFDDASQAQAKVNRRNHATNLHAKQHVNPNKQMSLLVGIFTRPKEFEERQNVRKIWASPFSAHLKSSYSKGATYTGSYLTFNNSRDEIVVCKIKTVFVLGIYEPQREEFNGTSTKMTTQKYKTGNRNFNWERREVQKAIDAESMIHGDIIQATFEENYSNLSYKTGALLNWASTHCNKAQFLLKLDLDIYARLDVLMSVLEKLTLPRIESEATRDRMVISDDLPSKNTFQPIISENSREKEVNPLDELMDFQKKLYCQVWMNVPTNREYGGKNYVDKEEYEPEYYPTFCSGWGYLMSPRLAGIFYNRSLESSAKPFPNEDVFWTGIIPEKVKGTGYENLNAYFKWTERYWGQTPYIFSSYLNMKHLRKLYFSNSYSYKK